MVGSGDRSERIRTYNFPQGRVTDHRINLTLHRLPEILEGQLDELIGALVAEDEAERLASLDEQSKVREALAVRDGRGWPGSAARPGLDAELLMAHALGLSREEMLLGRLDAPAPAAFDSLLARRLDHEPVAYITGRRAFWTIELEVGPGVLDPAPRQRDPDRGGDRAFRRSRAGADPRSRHRARHPAACGARPVARRDRARHRRIGRGACLCPPQRRLAAPNSAPATGTRGSTSAST